MLVNNKGSILLYVLFLSSFLALFFVSFQWQLENMLEWAKDSEQGTQEISDTQDALTRLKNTPSSSATIGNNENLSLISTNQSGTIITESLNGEDSREYLITSTLWATFMTLSVVSWGPVIYHTAAFDSWSESSATLVSSETVSDVQNIILSGSLDKHILAIESLGWDTKYTLDTSTTTIIPSSSLYTWERDINGYKMDMWTHKVVNFQPKSLLINYQKMGMYLRE